MNGSELSGIGLFILILYEKPLTIKFSFETVHGLPFTYLRRADNGPHVSNL